MKSLCLGYLDMRLFDSRPEAEKSAVLDECFKLCVPFRETRRIVAEVGLADSRAAKSIRPRDGRPTVTDGPFIETKEQLGSFFIVDDADIDEAVAIASMHPAALRGEQYGFGI